MKFAHLFFAAFVNSSWYDVPLLASWEPNEVWNTQCKPIRVLRRRVFTIDGVYCSNVIFQMENVDSIAPLFVLNCCKLCNIWKNDLWSGRSFLLRLSSWICNERSFNFVFRCNSETFYSTKYLDCTKKHLLGQMSVNSFEKVLDF